MPGTRKVKRGDWTIAIEIVNTGRVFALA